MFYMKQYIFIWFSILFYILSIVSSTILAQDGAILSLNTLTTACSGGCPGSDLCVIVGQASNYPICLNAEEKESCSTLLNGKAALCLVPFNDVQFDWSLSPSTNLQKLGNAPFERLGLIDVKNSITEVVFSQATTENEEPIGNPLDVSSFVLRPVAQLDRLEFKDLSLSGTDVAAPLNNVRKVELINCAIETFPARFLSGALMSDLDLTGSTISSIPSDMSGTVMPELRKLTFANNSLEDFNIPAESVPLLEDLDLSFNEISKFPKDVLLYKNLKSLNLYGNFQMNSSQLNLDDLSVLSKLSSLKMASDDKIPTPLCPEDTFIKAQLDNYFEFCVNQTKTPTPSKTPTPTDINEPSSSDSTGIPNKAPIKEGQLCIVNGNCWITIGLFVLLLLLLFLVIIFAFQMWKRSRQRYSLNPKTYRQHSSSVLWNNGASGDNGSSYVLMQPPLGLSNESSYITSDDSFDLRGAISNGYISRTRIPTHAVMFTKQIRVSARSELWRGMYEHESVLIKRMRCNGVSPHVMREFVAEIEYIAQLKHPRIAGFDGAMWDDNMTELCAVVENVTHGALRDSLTNVRYRLSMDHIQNIGLELAQAILFLHDHGIVHGRLTSFNVLLDSRYSAKLSSFAIYHYVKLSPLDKECRIFAAPEILRGQQPNEMTDVYAYGVILVELVTGQSPASNQQLLKLMRQRATTFVPSRNVVAEDSEYDDYDYEHENKYRGTHAQRSQAQRILNLQCSQLLQDIIVACLEHDPLRRPSMKQIDIAFDRGYLSKR